MERLTDRRAPGAPPPPALGPSDASLLVAARRSKDAGRRPTPGPSTDDPPLIPGPSTDERGRPAPDAPARIGLLGGTFDPPHYGHLLAAQEAAWRLGLDRVLFLPARRNPLKRDELPAPAEDRVRMVELAIAGNPAFALSRADLDRPPPSYTVDLLWALRRALPSDAELLFLVGADILPELPAWHAPAEVLRLARLVVVARPGAPPPDVAALERALPAARGRVIALATPGVDISSTEIRARVHAGRPIRYLTPEPVTAYILERTLYREPPRRSRPRPHARPALTP